MPTYQYACTACGHQLEAVQSFTDEPLNECPACEGRLRKLFNSVGIVFKGSGFYRTDSRSADKSGSDSSSSDSSKTPSPAPASSDKSTSSTSTSSSDKSSASTSSSSSSSSAKPAAATTS